MSLRSWVACVLAVGCSPVADAQGDLSTLSGGHFARVTAAVEARVKLATPPPPPAPPPVDCAALTTQVRAEPALPGTPRLDRERAETVARAKGEPVIFVRAPEWAPSDSAVIEGYRRTLEKSRFPWDLLKNITERFAHAPKVGRQVLLRDGYLYADRADVAWSLWHFVKLEHAFDEPRLWIERGSERLRVEKRDGRYVYASGSDEGKAARLMLFDRVGVEGDAPPPPLHRDARRLSHELGFERMRITHITKGHILADLRYGEHWVPSVLASDGAALRLACESVPEADAERVATARRRIAVRERVLSVLRAQMLKQVDAELPFDEPRTEWGQQDGHLRRYWEKAYFSGEDHYFFNHDRYPVFTAAGVPAAPQVCIDFITETLEAAAGTGFRPLGQPRQRRVGRFDFDAMEPMNRRRVTSFLAYAQENPELFEFETLPTSKRIHYLFKKRFYRHLEREAERYQPGDIVVIRGLAPWDHYAVPHYHTFFVYERDPVTGMPILLAGNAGKPRVQSWEAVMSRTPHRKIEYRVRPRLEWLSSIVDTSHAPEVRSAPPLVAMN